MSKPEARSIKWLGAEFLVLVLGVFLALSVDSCVERRRSRAQAQAYLTRLADDLADSPRRLTAIVDWARAVEGTGSQLMEFYDSGVVPNGDSLRLAVSALLAGRRIRVSFVSDTFDDLVATGNLGLISDPELRREISSFYDYLGRRMAALEDVPDDFPRLLHEIVPVEASLTIERNCALQDASCDVTLAPRLVEGVIKSLDQHPELAGPLRRWLYFMNLRQGTFERQLEMANELLPKLAGLVEQ